MVIITETILEDSFRNITFLFNLYSHFCEYPDPPTEKHTTFPKQDRDINKSLNKGYQIVGQTRQYMYLFIAIYI